MVALGDKIKQLRKQKKKTLKELAEKTDLSISFLSQLERGKSSATLESLRKISIELGVNPGYFFDDVSPQARGVVEVVDINDLNDKEQNIVYHSLANQIEAPLFEPLYVALKPGQNEGNQFKHPGQEFLYVLNGTLTVKLGAETYEVNAAQSIMFESDQPHYWYNYTDEIVTFLCVTYNTNLK